MSAEPDLFAYPHTAGYRLTDTSYAAAQAIDAPTLRSKVLDVLARVGPLTADQCSVALSIDKLSIRPRLTELKALGKVIDSGQRRPNSSGKRAIVWRLAA